MKDKFKGLVSVLLIVIVMSGCSLLPKEEQALLPPLVEPVRDNTETYEVQLGSIAKEVKGTGVFETTKIMNHQFTGSGGIVEEVFVKAGDSVKQGDVLIQLEIENLDLQILQQQLDLEIAKANFEQAKSSGNPQNIKLRGLEREIAELKYKKTSEALNRKQLIAEMDGTVIFVDAIQPLDRIHDHRTLVSIGDPSQLQFFYQATNSSDLAPVQVGMDIEITMGGEIYTGTITQTPFSAPFSEDSQLMQRYARTIYAQIEGLPADASLGDRAEFVVVTEHKDNVMIIPKSGLRSYLGRNYVYILNGESRQEVDVEVGIETATQVEIVRGIELGQLIILQ